MVPVRWIWPIIKLSLLAWPLVLVVNLVFFGDSLDRNTIVAAAVIIPAWLIVVPLLYVRWQMRRDGGLWAGADLGDAAEEIVDRFQCWREERRQRQGQAR